MKLRIGTRGSLLALKQTEIVAERLMKTFSDLDIEIVKIKTKGDKITDAPLAKIGGKGLFVKEIEEALQRGEVDIAVHSLKDMPTELPSGLYIAGVLKRESPADAFISDKVNSISELPEGAVIGTSSLRRQSIIKKYYPHLRVEILRGNLDTRIRKMRSGMYDGIIVAYAGLIRMGWESEAREILPTDIFIPSAGQGVICIEAREKDEGIRELLKGICDEKTFIEIKAERAFLTKLRGGCQVPMGVHAEVNDGKILIRAFISDLDGKRFIKEEIEGNSEEGERLGEKLGEIILEKGGEEILREIYGGRL